MLCSRAHVLRCRSLLQAARPPFDGLVEKPPPSTPQFLLRARLRTGTHVLRSRAHLLRSGTHVLRSRALLQTPPPFVRVAEAWLQVELL